MESTTLNPTITEYPSPILPHTYTEEEQIRLIEERFADILTILGLDLSDDSIAKTPRRVATMYVKELFSGLKEETFPSLTFISNDFYHNKTILISDISVTSCCEHHFLPIIGFAQVAYIPKNKIIGLSKINRIVSYFSHRPQLQERLTAQIASCLSQVLETDDIAVKITAQHSCVTVRGIVDKESKTTTTFFSGLFSDRQNPFSE